MRIHTTSHGVTIKTRGDDHGIMGGIHLKMKTGTVIHGEDNKMAIIGIHPEMMAIHGGDNKTGIIGIRVATVEIGFHGNPKMTAAEIKMMAWEKAKKVEKKAKATDNTGAMKVREIKERKQEMGT